MALPKTFTAGERLFAGDLNGNFEYLDNAIPTFKVHSGSQSSLTVSANSNLDTSVTFPSGLFTSTPSVVVTMSGSLTLANTDNINVFANSVTSTGFTIRLSNTLGSSQTVGVYWVAFQNAA